MKRSTAIIVAVLVAVLFAAGGVGLAVWQAGTASDTGGTAASGTADPAAEPQDGAAVDGETPAGDSAAEEADPEDDASAGEHDGSGAPAEYTLPPPTAAPTLIPGPAPRDAAADGEMVDGFPDGLEPPPASTVEHSSLSTDDGRVQASLTASSTSGVDELLVHYRTALAAYGMAELPAEAASGTTAVAFTRGDDRVTLVITPDGSGSSYELFGTLTSGDG
ncbi:hypothetical protein ACFVAJ_10910 [Agromyces sp. NPDC057679]|uniref:hypothetical protein n=1 Tax=Agromyces sp. NPDC057679 TaxID=3346207 RepID=UPI003671407E